MTARFHDAYDTPTTMDICRDTPLEGGARMLNLHRYGTFRIPVLGERHCGPETDGGIMPCDYDVNIECVSDHLDPDGFLVEQLGVHEFFQGLRYRPTRLSCELLTVAVAVDLHDLVRAENPYCEVNSIRVKIAPKPHRVKARKEPRHGADMTFSWHRSQGALRGVAKRRGVSGTNANSDPDVWVTGKGVRYRLSEMGDEHLANSFRFVVEGEGYGSARAAAFIKEMQRRQARFKSRKRG